VRGFVIAQIGNCRLGKREVRDADMTVAVEIARQKIGINDR